MDASPSRPDDVLDACTIPDAPATEVVGSRSRGSISEVGAKVIPIDPLRMIGRVLADRYRIERLIAQGAMGRVYLATQIRLDRVAAVKVMSQPEDPRFAARFCREASFASQLAHPNIVTVYDYGETDRGELFMAMEYCDGRPLHEVMFDEAPFGPDRVLSISIQIARALRKAHAQGVVHRDLKPANVIVMPDDDGTDFVKVLDFGLVKPFALDDRQITDENITRPGNMVGTPEYISPEQALGDQLDGRADVYSLGVMMFQMISGHLPFHGKSMLDTITQHFRLPVPRIADVAPGVDCPPEIEEIIRRALAKSRADRFASMDEMLVALKAAWRIVTDESFGTETNHPAVRAEDVAGDTVSDAARGEVNHEPVCLEFEDLVLPPMVRPDPSEVSSPAAPDLRPARAGSRVGSMIAMLLAAVLVVAVGIGAYTWSSQHAAPAVKAAPAVLSMPVEPVVVAPVAAVEKTIEAEVKPQPVKKARATRAKKAKRSFKDNPY